MSAPVDVSVAALRRIATDSGFDVLDSYVGSPSDAVPDFVSDVVRAAVADSAPYPLSAGSAELRDAAARWINRRFGVTLSGDAVGACVGTKEFVASFVHHLRYLRGRDRDVVLYPEIAYSTYAVGARLAGCRPVAVPLDAQWNLDLSRVDPNDAANAVVLWVNSPANPTGAVADRAHLEGVVAWARANGVIVVSDECYIEFAPTAPSALEISVDGVLALHSLSKRSNFAGMRCGFYAGDEGLVSELIALRREAGLIVSTPIQRAAVAVLDDDAHVAKQHDRYAARRAFVLERLKSHGIEHCGGPMPFYAWLRSVHEDGDALALRFARAGWVVAPGSSFGPAAAPYVRIAMVHADGALQCALDRFDAVESTAAILSE